MPQTGRTDDPAWRAWRLAFAIPVFAIVLGYLTGIHRLVLSSRTTTASTTTTTTVPDTFPGLVTQSHSGIEAVTTPTTKPAGVTGTSYEPPAFDRYRYLKDANTMILVDDSETMAYDLHGDFLPDDPTQSRWAAAKEVLRAIVPVCAEKSEYGIDLCFGRRNREEPYENDAYPPTFAWSNIKNDSGSAVAALVDAARPDHLSRMEKRLGELVHSHYKDWSCCKYRHGIWCRKPLNLIVITDGSWVNGDTECQFARYAADLHDAPRDQLGIQFVQVGDYGEAARTFQTLDRIAAHPCALVGWYRDIFDTVKWNVPVETPADQVPESLIEKIALGAMKKDIDKKGEPK